MMYICSDGELQCLDQTDFHQAMFKQSALFKCKHHNFIK